MLYPKQFVFSSWAGAARQAQWVCADAKATVPFINFTRGLAQMSRSTAR
jgi:hypothetical protein